MRRDRHGRIYGPVSGAELNADSLRRMDANPRLDEIDRFARYVRRERHIDASFGKHRGRLRVEIRPHLRAMLQAWGLARRAVIAWAVESDRARKHVCDLEYQLHRMEALRRYEHVQVLFRQPTLEKAATHAASNRDVAKLPRKEVTLAAVIEAKYLDLRARKVSAKDASSKVREHFTGQASAATITKALAAAKKKDAT